MYKLIILFVTFLACFWLSKHLERYLDEYSARFNTRTLSGQERFEKFLVDSESVLSYKRLTIK